jgi:hypothetical protein
MNANHVVRGQSARVAGVDSALAAGALLAPAGQLDVQRGTATLRRGGVSMLSRWCDGRSGM